MFIDSLQQKDQLTRNDIVADLEALCALLKHIKSVYNSGGSSTLKRDAKGDLQETLLEGLLLLGSSVKTRRGSQSGPSSSEQQEAEPMKEVPYDLDEEVLEEIPADYEEARGHRRPHSELQTPARASRTPEADGRESKGTGGTARQTRTSTRTHRRETKDSATARTEAQD